MEQDRKTTSWPMGLVTDAAMKCTRNVSWKDSVLRWKIPRNHLLFCYRIKAELEKGTYKPAPFVRFMVTEPKPREIKAPAFRDRTVQTAALDGGLRDNLSRGFIHDNVACQKDKGMSLGLDRLKCMLQRFFRLFGLRGWGAKVDVHDYYASIEHEGLKHDVRQVADNQDYMRETEVVIDSFGDIGLGLGSPMSQQLALFRLSALDHRIKEYWRCRFYVRYNDDSVILHPDKETLKEIVADYARELAKLGLELNPKSCIFPLSQGVVFLKWRFKLTDTGRIVMRKRRKSVSRYTRHLRDMKRQRDEGELTDEDIRNSFTSWESHMAMGNSARIINKTRRLLNA
jgi:hypothetical protein